MLHHQPGGMPGGHDVRPDPALDEVFAATGVFIEETFPRSRLTRQRDGEHIQPVLWCGGHSRPPR